MLSTTLRIVGGISVWVLTGDKVETAVNIAMSCKLIKPGMKEHFLYADEETLVSEDKNDPEELDSKKLAMIVQTRLEEVGFTSLSHSFLDSIVLSCQISSYLLDV